jgi:1-deoxy-D-xylulose-5-phosphate reductoisomerase
LGDGGQDWSTAPRDVEDVLAADSWARAHARELLKPKGL